MNVQLPETQQERDARLLRQVQARQIADEARRDQERAAAAYQQQQGRIQDYVARSAKAAEIMRALHTPYESAVQTWRAGLTRIVAAHVVEYAETGALSKAVEDTYNAYEAQRRTYVSEGVFELRAIWLDSLTKSERDSLRADNENMHLHMWANQHRIQVEAIPLIAPLWAVYAMFISGLTDLKSKRIAQAIYYVHKGGDRMLDYPPTTDWTLVLANAHKTG